jgi:hypothetical protein
MSVPEERCNGEQFDGTQAKMIMNFKSNRRIRDVLNGSVVKGIYRLLVLAIPE